MSKRVINKPTQAEFEEWKKEFFDALDQLLKQQMSKIGESTADDVQKAIRIELEVFRNFMVRVEAKLDAQSRMLYFIAKNRLSREEIREMLMISQEIRDKSVEWEN